MDEVREKDLEPWQTFLVVTAICFGVMSLMVHFKFNVPSNAVWPYVRFICKGCLFGWIFYGGIKFGTRKLSKELKQTRDRLEKELKEKDKLYWKTVEEKSEYFGKWQTLKFKYDETVFYHEQRENELREQLKKQQSAVDVNHQALKSFL